jgi:hypothetical protein
MVCIHASCDCRKDLLSGRTSFDSGQARSKFRSDFFYCVSHSQTMKPNFSYLKSRLMDWVGYPKDTGGNSTTRSAPCQPYSARRGRCQLAQRLKRVQKSPVAHGVHPRRFILIPAVCKWEVSVRFGAGAWPSPP